MNRMRRAVWSLAALAVCVITVLALTSLGTRLQGPLAAVVSDIGTGVSELEIRLLRPFRGPGRSAEADLVSAVSSRYGLAEESGQDFAGSL